MLSQLERSPCSSPISRAPRACFSSRVTATPTCCSGLPPPAASRLPAHHGHEVDTQGDAFFVAFARATDAVSAAVEAQRALASSSLARRLTVRVRMGLHTGDRTYCKRVCWPGCASCGTYHGCWPRGPNPPLTDDPRSGGTRAAGGREPT